jgi:hypothetical protein
MLSKLSTEMKRQPGLSTTRDAPPRRFMSHRQRRSWNNSWLLSTGCRSDVAPSRRTSRLGDKLDSLELRLRSAPRAGQAPALLEELTDLRSHLTERVRLLEETNAAAPAAPPIPSGRLHRTRRRGIYRAGSTYVVLVADDNGVKHAKVATTLAEALELRETLKAARRRVGNPHDRQEPHSPSGGGAM